MKTNIQFLQLALLLFFCVTGYSQFTGTFSADNCYAVYVGNSNSVSNKVLPQSGNGHCNRKASEIFSPTSNTFNGGSNDYFYIIAWSDDKTCQGLIGEFTGQQTIKTGDRGWQVYATKKNYGNGQAPSAQEISTYISQANTRNGWEQPFVGSTNAKSKKSCRAYAKVNGISDGAKWIWYNSLNTNNPLKVLGQGRNHHEFLIFRFPIKKIVTPGGGDENDIPNFDACCPPIAKQDLSSMLFVNGNMNTYTTKFQWSAEFTNRLRAYANYAMALDPCLKNVTFEYVIRKPHREPNSFNLAGNTILSRGATYFNKGQNRPQTWGQGTLSDVTLKTNQWYRLEIVAYGGPSESCSKYNFTKGCDLLSLEFNIMTNKIRTGGNKLNGSLKSIGATLK